MWVGCRRIHKAVDLVLEFLWHNLEQVEALFGDLVGGDWLKVFSGQLCTDTDTQTLGPRVSTQHMLYPAVHSKHNTTAP